MSKKSLNICKAKTLNNKAIIKASLLLFLIPVILSSSIISYFWLFGLGKPVKMVVEEYSETEYSVTSNIECILPYYDLDNYIIQEIKSQLGIQTLIHLFTYNLAEIGKSGNYSIFETEILPNESFNVPNLLEVLWQINNGHVQILKNAYMSIVFIEQHENSTVIYEGEANGKRIKIEEIYKGTSYLATSNIDESPCQPRGPGYVVRTEAQIVRHYAFFGNEWTLLSETAAKGRFYIIPDKRVEKVVDLSYDWVSWYTYRCIFNHNKEGEGSIAAMIRTYGKYRETLCPGLATHWDASPYIMVDAFGHVERNPKPQSWWIQFGCC